MSARGYAHGCAADVATVAEDSTAPHRYAHGCAADVGGCGDDKRGAGQSLAVEYADAAFHAWV